MSFDATPIAAFAIVAAASVLGLAAFRHEFQEETK